jgi:iron complex transport system substrate-binding protein
MAAAANRTIADRFEAVRRRVAGLPPVSALIVLGRDATGLAGPDTYLDDVLQIAGGTNAAAGLGKPWPTVDREMLLSLHPAAVLILLPGAKPQELAQARATWAQLPTLAPGRVYTITDPYAQQPGWHLPDLAERFAQCLHPSIMPTSAP